MIQTVCGGGLGEGDLDDNIRRRRLVVSLTLAVIASIQLFVPSKQKEEEVMGEIWEERPF